MSLNYLSYATLPLPQMDRDFLLAQDDKSIFRYVSLLTNESVAFSSTKVRSYLFVFLGSVTVSQESDKDNEENITSGEIYRLDDKSGLVHITATTDAVIYHVDSIGMEKLVSWAVISKLMEGDKATAKRLNLLMNFSSLNTLPLDSAFELSQRMIETTVKKGEDIVAQGDPADSFYIIMEGTADVCQTNHDNNEPKLVAKLTAGDSFGEDALITEGTRNATVTMTSDGRLLICKREDFQELIAHRSITEISSSEVKKLIDDERYNLVDVRYQDEYEESHIENSLLIPLSEIRKRLTQFNSNETYILYCNDGQRSAVGAMILTQAGITAVSLQEGMASWPGLSE